MAEAEKRPFVGHGGPIGMCACMHSRARLHAGLEDASSYAPLLGPGAVVAPLHAAMCVCMCVCVRAAPKRQQLSGEECRGLAW